jgi:hypothetical protein
VDFKVQYLNGLQVKSITAPKELNTIFDLANNWLKPKALAGRGYASTYAAKADFVEKKKAVRRMLTRRSKTNSKPRE